MGFVGQSPRRRRVAEESESFDRAFSDALRDETSVALAKVEVAADRPMRAAVRVLFEVRGGATERGN